MKYAIVGGGVAAFEAAQAIRNSGDGGEITLYSREAVLPYRRPALTGMVAEALPDAQFYLKTAAFFEEKEIKVELKTAVTAVDPIRKELTLADGSRRKFDRLLLATGGRSFRPPVPGINGPNVLSLRELSDLEELRRRLDRGLRRAVVIGGGLLGLELAESLLARGCEVAVVEGCPNLLPRNLDAEAANIVLGELARVPGLTLHFGAMVEAITPEGVSFGGKTVAADLVMISTGLVADTTLAKAAGLKSCRGILVDGKMRTNFPDIYAAGDCAEYQGRVFGLYTAARDMGRTAGANLAGGAVELRLEAYPARLAVFKLKIFSAGILEGENAKTTFDPETNQFEKLFYNASNQLVGAILIGDLKKAAQLQAEIVSLPC